MNLVACIQVARHPRVGMVKDPRDRFTDGHELHVEIGEVICQARTLLCIKPEGSVLGLKALGGDVPIFEGSLDFGSHAGTLCVRLAKRQIQDVRSHRLGGLTQLADPLERFLSTLRFGCVSCCQPLPRECERCDSNHTKQIRLPKPCARIVFRRFRQIVSPVIALRVGAIH